MEQADKMERETTTSYQALRQNRQGEILGRYSPQEQQEIRYRQQILSSLAYFIGKDFQIPVYVGLPTPYDPSGWHYGVNQKNLSDKYIQMNVQDLLEMPLERLRFRTEHEAGHARVTRFAEVIPLEEWKQTGFSFLMNAIEDPRNNNFVTEAYPKSRGDMAAEYEGQSEEEKKAKALAKERLGHTPDFMQAGFEYIKQWYRETQGDTSGTLSEDLPEEVKKVVQATLDSARDSWLRYPSRQEADGSEDLIRRYARVSYEINRDEIWAEFKKLVDADLEDQRLQELLQEMQEGQGAEGEGQGGLPQNLKDKLAEEEQRELEEAIQNAQSAGKGQEGQEAEGSGKPHIVDLDSLSESLGRKIKDYLDSLPEDVKRRLQEKAQKALQDYEEEVNEELAGKLSDNPDKKAERQRSTAEKKPAAQQKPEGEIEDRVPSEEAEDQRKFRDLIEQALQRDENAYEEYRREVLPLIDTLETDLREIFVARRAQKWQSGFRAGKRIDIKKRMQEKALGISPVESKAWQKQELPQEKDYAISLLVDLSSSMRGQKIEETFKAAIVLAEVLNRLSISTEILGFNDRLYEYQGFGQNLGTEVREHMGGMLQEVNTPAAAWNDDGWAVLQASERLARQKAAEKFLFVLSDGLPKESDRHSRSQYELGQIVARIMQDTDQKLIGLGIGHGTEHVERYYPNSVANIGVREMAEKLADVIRGAIANYETF